MLVDNKYNIGDEVYLTTDPDQRKRIVTLFIVSNNDIRYELNCGIESGWYYDIEISTEINVLV